MSFKRHDLYRETPGVGCWKISFAEYWGYYTRPCLVILDDVGLFKVSDNDRELLQGLLDRRKAKPTILISNYDLDALAHRYGDPVGSRLGGGTVVAMPPRDRRLDP